MQQQTYKTVDSINHVSLLKPYLSLGYVHTLLDITITSSLASPLVIRQTITFDTLILYSKMDGYDSCYIVKFSCG